MSDGLNTIVSTLVADRSRTILSDPNITLGLAILAGLIGLLILFWLINQVGLYARRHLLGHARQRVFEQAFTDFCYQPFAEGQDVAGISNFPALADEFKTAFSPLLQKPKPEIYHLIDDHQDQIHRSVFDLRTLSIGVDGSRTTAITRSAFLINLPAQTLTAFCLGREGLGNMTVWGEDPDIDIEGEFIFSQNYHLTGPDRNAVIKLFDSELVSFIRTHTALFSACRLDVNQNALLLRHAEALDPDRIRSTLDILSKLILLLSR